MVLSTQLRSRLLSILARRSFNTTALRQEVHPVYAKMKETSKLYQLNNGLSVHEKKGAADKVALGAINVSAAIVLGWTGYEIYKLAGFDKY